MKIGIFSHCTIDTIKLLSNTYEQIGGAACYCTLTADSLGMSINLFTKFGKDFSKINPLNTKWITKDALSEIPTTRFLITIDGAERKLFLTNFCEPVDYDDGNFDASIVTPVFDEISLENFKKIKNSSDYIFLDPQGFLRRKNSTGQIYLEKTQLDLSKIDAIKTDPEEIFNLTGLRGIEAMKNLQERGIKHVLVTNKREISLLIKDKIYSINLPNLELFDTTGVGDIFVSSFCSTWIKEEDFIWALSFAGGAAQAALESKQVGLKKVPQKGAIETNAAYFYNQIKFKQV